MIFLPIWLLALVSLAVTFFLDSSSKTYHLKEKNEQVDAARASETRHGQPYISLLQIAFTRHSIAMRNTKKNAAVLFVVLIIITPTILYADSSMVSAQSGLLFQKMLGDDAMTGFDVAVDSLDNIYATAYVLRSDPVNHEYGVVFLQKCDPTGTSVWQRI